MANVLKVAMQDSIITLHENGHSQREICKLLGASRKTVRRYIRLHESKALSGHEDPKSLISTAGSGPGPPTPKPAISTAGSPGRRSACEPFRETIEDKVELGLSAQRIWQDLNEREDFTASYESVKRFVRRFEERMELPFRRMECPPGREAQVDFGKGAFILGPDGKRTRPHLFRMILSHSGAGYSEVVRRQDTETFIRCIENAFRCFGGVTETLVCDNLKAAVTKADWYDPEIHPKVRDFCRHYGTVILPTKPRTPRHKGKVEKSIDFVQSNALKGRTFSSLAEQNAHLLRWERKVADTRIHGTTRRQVRKALEAERDYLAPLPDTLFPAFREGQRRVNRDGHVEVDRAYYSVPPEFHRSTVWVRWDGAMVRVFDHSFREVAVHPKHEPGRFSTLAGHISARKISGFERGEGWLMGKLRLVGRHTEAWSRALMANRGIEGLRVLQGLLSLVSKHHDRDIERACRTCLDQQSFRLKDVRQALASVREEPLLFADEHPLIRSIEEYGSLVPFPLTEET
jgi:transposase